MDDAAFVRRFECLGNLPADDNGVGHWDVPGCRRGAGCDDIEERPTGHELHDQAVGADVVERADVRMVEGGNGACLALEPAADFRRGDLDGHVASEAGVARLIHLAHPAGSEQAANLVGPEPLAATQFHEVGILNPRLRGRSRSLRYPA